VESVLSLPGVNTGRVRETLTNLALAFTHPREAEIGPLPDFITKELSGQRVGLVDFNDDEAERLCSVLESFGARPLLFTASEPPLSDAIRSCNAILVHVRPGSTAAGWLDPGSPEPEPAVVLVGGRDSILAVDPFIQARVSEFLIDGWQPEEALMRLKYAISRTHPGRMRTSSPPCGPNRLDATRTRVLIADDDEIVVSRLRNALEAHGMQCWTAATGCEALALISTHHPQAAIFDVNMPGKSGFDVLAEIRAAGLTMPVLLLTASGGDSNVIKGFNLGADDYVVKPFSPAEVAVRLKRLLRTAVLDG
jgi:CheY-like chemotaxis protein